MMKDTYCSFCGTAYQSPLAYPRKCLNPACGIQVWANPIPVSLALVPVLDGDRTGLLVVRRGIEPRIGFLTLPGGFVEEQETWQEAAAREAMEEAGVRVDPKELLAFWFASTRPNPSRILLFSSGPAHVKAELPPFSPNEEATERGLVYGPDGLEAVFAFPLHVEAARRFFLGNGIEGPHGFEVC